MLQPLEIPQWKWEQITMDIVSGLPNTIAGHDSVWVIVDRLTKSAHFLPIKTTHTVDKLAELYIKEIVRLHGVPSSIVLTVMLASHPASGRDYKRTWGLA